jgi:hypothetical protein
MKPTKRILLVAVLAVVLALAGVYFWGPSKTPAGQPPLSTLSEATFTNFQMAFDSAPDEPRIVLLLSPT